MIEDVIINKGKNYKTRVPTIRKWQGQQFMTSHSLRAAVHEILAKAKNMDVVKIGLVGDTGTGKSTLAETLAHLIHTISLENKWIDWIYRAFGQKEYLDFEKTVSELPVANYILYFHDLSFLTEHKQIERVKQSVTKLRHMREDVRIIMIIDYHYTKGLDKYLRQSDFKFFTAIGESEHENLQDIISTKNRRVMNLFIRQHELATMTNQYVFKLGKNDTFAYDYRNPFALALYWNHTRARHVIYPKRTWLAPVCRICSPETKPELDSACLPEIKKQFGSNAPAAAKYFLISHGLISRSTSWTAALKKISKEYEAGHITAEQIVKFFKL